MFMQEVPVALELLVVHFGYELHVLACSFERNGNSLFVLALAEVQVLPRRELGTHRRSYEKDRLLLALHSSRLVALFFLAEIPWLAVFWIDDGEV